MGEWRDVVTRNKTATGPSCQWTVAGGKILRAIILIPSNRVITLRSRKDIRVPILIQIDGINRTGVIDTVGDDVGREPLGTVVLVPGDRVVTPKLLKRHPTSPHAAVSASIWVASGDGPVAGSQLDFRSISDVPIEFKSQGVKHDSTQCNTILPVGGDCDVESSTGDGAHWVCG